MDGGKGLRRFEVRRFIEIVAKGTEERARVEDEERKEQEREAQKKMKEARRDMWTTPRLRPLAEPPILDWDYFFRTWIPSDLRYKALFPDDPEKRCRMKDVHGEGTVLAEYSYCTGVCMDDLQTDVARAEFYANLLDDVRKEYHEVDKEYEKILETASALGLFEFLRLDNDGHTTGLEKWIEKGADIFYDQVDEVKVKYQHLVPPDFVEYHLATFEFVWLNIDGGQGSIRGYLNAGHDILEGWPQEVLDKYGHLRRFLPPAAQEVSSSESDNLETDDE